MSLPAYAKYYKGDEFLGELFVNIGWFYNEDDVPELVEIALIEVGSDMERLKKISMEKFEKHIEVVQKIKNGPWDRVDLYGKSFTRDELKEIDRLNQVYNMVRVYAYQINGPSCEPGYTPPPEKIYLPKIENPCLDVTIDDILTCQDMTAETGEVFKLTKSYKEE